MIIDSSALVAILLREAHSTVLRDAILGAKSAAIPATAMTEIQLVLGGRGQQYQAAAAALFEVLLGDGIEVVAFDQRHADITAFAREAYGKGNGRGGLLNFGDLMVYAIAKDRGEPVLCTGQDFASTDLAIHPASRLEP